MSNGNNEGRFLKEAFRGVPAGYGLTREEQILRTQNKQLEEMRAIKDRFRGPTNVPVYPHEPRVQVAAPQIHIDIPNVADELRPQFDNLLDTQEKLAGSVRNLGFQGELALREFKVHSGLLTSLDDAAKVAYQQRNAALNMMARSIIDHGNAIQSVRDVGMGVRSDIQHGNVALSRVQGALQTSNRSLFSIDRGIGNSNRFLSAINEGIDQGNDLLTQLGVTIENLESSVLSSLGELGSAISGLSRQLVLSTLQVLDGISGFEDVFLWAHREKMANQRRILYSLQNPVGMKAMNLWSLGERARKIGDYDQAIQLYHQSLGIDPTAARPYFSIAMIALERGDILLARDFMNTAYAYAIDEPELKALILMYLSKVEKFDGDNEKSLFLCEKAFEIFRYNLEIWYELALNYMEVGDFEKALYFIKNILLVARKTNPGYVYKVIATPQFFQILEPIRNILSTL